jgi:hypothetical protein
MKKAKPCASQPGMRKAWPPGIPRRSKSILYYNTKSISIHCTTSRISKYSTKNRNGKTTAKALEMYKIERVATFLDHQCVNVVERILKDQTHPITQKQTVKSHHKTRSSQHIPATARTKTYQNSCLQKSLRIKRDGYINKYTNPRKAETTTPEYISLIQDLKKQAKKF